ncbi:MAG: TIGR03790 family protein, partial [Akkermansiaceae bacterium]|nr:TIGR03790 family protein [Akkermansiaceae bacterium]
MNAQILPPCRGLHWRGPRAMLPRMRIFLPGMLVGLCLAPLDAAPLEPSDVAVLYNSAVPESELLARLYCELRHVPASQLIGLEMPATADISREQFEESIRKPLAEAYAERGYWRLGRDRDGRVVPAFCDKPVLLIMRGVPLRIKTTAKPEGFKPDPKNPFAGRDEAAVDSELAVAGLSALPGDVHPVGPLKNPYFQKDEPFKKAAVPALLLTCRIDAAKDETCERMIRDAVATEANGLWGLAYVDFANKGREGEGYQMGEDWLEGVLKANIRTGIPTVIDRFADTLPKNYPMTRASLYYGWYDWHVSGPFLNPAFRFRPGAVAMHLHSFSAQQLADPAKNWSAALLERGAAATVGNVFEPYLGPTHHFNILHERLLAGWTWVEAAWAAMPVTSWQGIVLGDPLYRPFARLDGGGKR